MQKKGCCRECKYAEWDASVCTCMIDGFFVCDASEHTCDQYRPAKPMTNADRIRQMTDEELADFLLEARAICKLCKKRDEICEGAYHECWNGIDDWLKQEVSEDA